MNYAKSCFLNLFAFFRLFAFLLYTIFLPSTFSGTHVRTVRAGSIRPTPLFFLSDWFITLSGKLLKPFLLSPRSYSECKPKIFGGRSSNYCQILQPERAPGPVS